MKRYDCVNDYLENKVNCVECAIQYHNYFDNCRYYEIMDLVLDWFRDIIEFIVFYAKVRLEGR